MNKSFYSTRSTDPYNWDLFIGVLKDGGRKLRMRATPLLEGTAVSGEWTTTLPFKRVYDEHPTGRGMELYIGGLISGGFGGADCPHHCHFPERLHDTVYLGKINTIQWATRNYARKVAGDSAAALSTWLTNWQVAQSQYADDDSIAYTGTSRRDGTISAVISFWILRGTDRYGIVTCFLDFDAPLTLTLSGYGIHQRKIELA